LENMKQQEIERSKAELAITKIQMHRQTEIANTEAENAVEQRNIEMQKIIQEKRQELEREKERADTLSKTVVAAESQIAEANGEAKKIEVLAQANLISAQKLADAKAYQIEKDAAAKAKAMEIMSAAALIEAENIAKGNLAKYAAEATGLRELMSMFGDDKNAFLQWFLAQRGTIEKLAESNAKAVQNLNPKITIWNTTSDPNNSWTSGISDLFKTIPPLLTTINDQTGLQPPTWLAQTKNK
jgi:flotillin